MKKSNKYITLIFSILIGLSFFLVSNPAYADEFKCFQAGNCDPPALSNSEKCQTPRDYIVTVNQNEESDVVVISPHGYKIETYTSTISKDIADKYNWSRYDFSANVTEDGNPECLGGLSYFKRLHITSSNFDEPQALAIVTAHPKSVSIHGYASRRRYPEGVICVGGKNEKQRNSFINYINTHNDRFNGYALDPIDATKNNVDSPYKCEDLGGVLSTNIVNKNSNGMGLQLELNKVMRKNLVDSSSDYDELRNVFYEAITEAMER